MTQSWLNTCNCVSLRQIWTKPIMPPPHEFSMSSLRSLEPIKMMVSISIFWHVLFHKLSNGGKNVYKIMHRTRACSVAKSCPTLQDPVNFSPPGIHTMFRYLRLKALKKSTHQNINSATDRTVVFWVFYFLLYTVQNFLKFLWPGYISFSSEKKIH